MKRPGKCRKSGKEAEPVDHFKEWTTSSGGEAGKGPETELVDHFEEWTTGWGGLPFLALLSLLF